MPGQHASVWIERVGFVMVGVFLIYLLVMTAIFIAGEVETGYLIPYVVSEFLAITVSFILIAIAGFGLAILGRYSFELGMKEVVDSVFEIVEVRRGNLGIITTGGVKTGVRCIEHLKVGDLIKIKTLDRRRGQWFERIYDASRVADLPIQQSLDQ